MCLEIIAILSPDTKGPVFPSRLSRLTGLSVTFRRNDRGSCLHFAVTGGCSCEFLSDDAKLESEVWALEPVHLSRLADAIGVLRTECGKFSFLAHWLDGERERVSERIAASELTKLVEENRVGNNVLYRVG